MRKEALLEILSDWNLWTKKIDTGIPRESYQKEIKEILENTNQILCLTGVRRSGKSTLIKQIAQETADHHEKTNTLIVNFEDERFHERTLITLKETYNCYREKVKTSEGRPYIFLDEIQTVNQWERFVRGLHERKEAELVVSGSSSKLLSEELATLLTGRHVTLILYPLSFKEFLLFKHINIQSDLDRISRRIEIKQLLDEYLEYGGFPEVVLSTEKERLLLSYFDTIITRDIINRFKIRDREKIKTLAKFYLTNISSHISYNKIARFLAMPLTTVERYSHYLETAHVLFFIKKYSYSLKEQEKAKRKVYSIDIGLSNTIGFRFLKKQGKLMENIVALELKRRQTFDPTLEIYYWQDYQQREVDFLLKKKTRVIQAIQVSANIDDINTKEREVKSLVKAMNLFQLNEGVIITADIEDEETINGKMIRYTPLWKWLLE